MWQMSSCTPALVAPPSFQQPPRSQGSMIPPTTTALRECALLPGSPTLCHAMQRTPQVSYPTPASYAPTPTLDLRSVSVSCEGVVGAPPCADGVPPCGVVSLILDCAAAGAEGCRFGCAVALGTVLRRRLWSMVEMAATISRNF